MSEVCHSIHDRRAPEKLLASTGVSLVSLPAQTSGKCVPGKKLREEMSQAEALTSLYKLEVHRLSAWAPIFVKGRSEVKVP